MKAKKIMQTVEEYYEIAPAKDKEVCSNCSYWFGWGVCTGMCVQLRHDTNQSFTCDKFDLTENRE